jgi:hypothetical protein
MRSACSKELSIRVSTSGSKRLATSGHVVTMSFHSQLETPSGVPVFLAATQIGERLLAASRPLAARGGVAWMLHCSRL